MEQMTATVRQNADTAHEANKLASSASQIATKGVTAVGDVVSTVALITYASRKIGKIAEITSASAEQSTGIAQVSQAVKQLDEMTQQNAAMVEQSSAAAGSMQEQAQRLSHAVQVFSMNRA